MIDPAKRAALVVSWAARAARVVPSEKPSTLEVRAALLRRDAEELRGLAEKLRSA